MRRPPILVLLVFAAVAAGTAFHFARRARRGDRLSGPAATPGTEAAAPAGEAAIRSFCSACHAFPPPAILSRESWKTRVESMYAMLGYTKDEPPKNFPPAAECVDYFTERAPAHLPPAPSSVPDGPGPLRLERIPLKFRDLPSFPGVANVRFVHLLDDQRFDLLVSEMRFGMVLVMRPYAEIDRIRLLGRVPHPVHAAVTDLDRDGLRDVLVADLGTVIPSDATNGSVVWLQGKQDGSYAPVTLAAGLPRVADAEAADFDGDGDQDVVVAAFGWRKVGEIILLDNRTAVAGPPLFESRSLDPRPGAIHVPVADLNGDGRPDFVALISQQFETVVAFLNAGGGAFEKQTLFTAEHPNWGSSGIELIDFDGDGDLDVFLANGDTLDDLVLKPYHGITLLENHGGYPFLQRRLTDMCGVHYAKAADLDGDGDLDVAASSFLPYLKASTPGAELADSIAWLEQTAPSRFRRWSLEATTCVHPTLDAADFDGDGDPDIATGNMTMAKGTADTLEDSGLILKNLRK